MVYPILVFLNHFQNIKNYFFYKFYFFLIIKIQISKFCISIINNINFVQKLKKNSNKILVIYLIKFNFCVLVIKNILLYF